MQKIFTLIKIMLRSKFIFKTPKKHDLILFDDDSFFDMKNVISGFNYFILQVRTERVTKVYISFKIFRNIFKNFSVIFLESELPKKVPIFLNLLFVLLFVFCRKIWLGIITYSNPL